MTAHDAINKLSELLPNNAIAIECQVDNFDAAPTTLRVNYTVYIATSRNYSGPTHFTKPNIEDAVNAAIDAIQLHRAACTPYVLLAADAFSSFLSCSSAEQDAENLQEVKS